MKLILEQIEKKFDKKEVLRGAGFTFEKGKIYGLLGRNGAGKTTMRILKLTGGAFILRRRELKDRLSQRISDMCFLRLWYLSFSQAESF